MSNFFLDLLNGNIITETYTIADNAGHSQSFTIPPNTAGGQELYSIPASGTVVTITSAATGGFWDFLIDNVGFDQPTPAPEPASMAILIAGLAGLATIRRRKAN